MQVIQAICGYCGNERRSKDDINNGKSFCKKCAGERVVSAQHAFRDRRTSIVANGKYVLSKQYTRKNQKR